MADETARELPGQPEQWVCMGTRVGAGGKTYTAWLPTTDTPDSADRADDLSLWYGGKNTYGAGYIYNVRVQRTDGDNGPRTTLYSSHITWAGRWAANDTQSALTAEWSARDRAAKARLAESRLAKKARTSAADPLNVALIPLQRIAAKLRTRDDKDAFAALVLRALNDAWNTGPYRDPDGIWDGE